MKAVIEQISELNPIIKGALHSKALGPIDIVWGVPGDAKNDYAGGYGISHTLAKHGKEALEHAPQLLAFGKYYKDVWRKGGWLVVKGPWVAALNEDKNNNIYLSTIYQSTEKAARYSRSRQIENKVGDEGATL